MDEFFNHRFTCILLLKIILLMFLLHEYWLFYYLNAKHYQNKIKALFLF